MSARAVGIAVIFAVLLPASHVFAQFASYLPLIGDEKEVGLTLSPAEPRAGETVNLSIDSSAIDIDRSEVTWYANNKQFARGPGLKNATIVAGPLGSETMIEVVVESAETTGRAIARIRPINVDIIWDADSYVPPFYKGRAMPGTSGSIHTYALVRFQNTNGTTLPESSIIYSWYRNGTRMAQLSGRGKSTATFESSTRFGADSIKVVAESVDERFTGSATVNIPRAETKLILYENHPLFGILFHRAIVGEVNTIEREQKVSVFPYFASVLHPDDSTLSYSWRVNDMDVIPEASDPNSLSITTENYTGPAEIKLNLTSGNDIFMRALGSWRILFSESSGAFFESNVFGQ